jgi:hypothetical protein
MSRVGDMNAPSCCLHDLQRLLRTSRALVSDNCGCHCEFEVLKAYDVPVEVVNRAMGRKVQHAKRVMRRV